MRLAMALRLFDMPVIEVQQCLYMKLFMRVIMVVLLSGALSGPVIAAGADGNAGGSYSKEDIEQMEQVVKSGKTVSLGKDGGWSISGTGTAAEDPESMLAKFEHLPGGKTAVAIGRKIISMYKEYLAKLEVYARDIGI